MNGRIFGRLMHVTMLAVLTSIAFHGTAYAYIDPGTGGMLLQLLLGGVAGGLVIVRLYWQRLREIMARMLGRSVLEKTDTD